MDLCVKHDTKVIVNTAPCNPITDEFLSKAYMVTPNEIEAEYYGIMNTYEYLCDTFPNIDKNIHEQLMVNFVNQKSEQYSYWIHHSNDKQFTSLFEIEQAFDNLLNRASQFANRK